MHPIAALAVAIVALITYALIATFVFDFLEETEVDDLLGGIMAAIWPLAPLLWLIVFVYRRWRRFTKRLARRITRGW